MELKLITTSSKVSEGEIAITAHLEPEGDGTHEKVIAQTKIEGTILPPGIKFQVVEDEGPFTPEQEARIRQIVQEMLPSD